MKCPGGSKKWSFGQLLGQSVTCRGCPLPQRTYLPVRAMTKPRRCVHTWQSWSASYGQSVFPCEIHIHRWTVLKGNTNKTVQRVTYDHWWIPTSTTTTNQTCVWMTKGTLGGARKMRRRIWKYLSDYRGCSGTGRRGVWSQRGIQIAYLDPPTHMIDAVLKTTALVIRL